MNTYLTPHATAEILFANAAHHAMLAGKRRERDMRLLAQETRQPVVDLAVVRLLKFPLIGLST